MDVIHPTCAGLDVHKDSVVACARVGTGPKGARALKPFGTGTRELLALSAWLTAHGCTHVAMEAPGGSWRPVWHVLAGRFELVLAHAMHIRNIPGRKSDVNDATWIADRLAHGLIRSSFVPAAPLQDRRDLTRPRTQLIRERARHILRIPKLLATANIKLASLLADILGVTGRRRPNAPGAGESDPERLADLAHDPRLKASRAEFVEALHGRLPPHHRFMLRLHLRQLDALDAAGRELEARLEAALGPFRPALARLTTIRGIADTTAHVLLAEIGVDMSHFPTAGHLISWAGLCPRLHKSAGKRRSTRTRRGTRWLKTTLVQAAWGAVRHPHGGYLRAQFVRLRSRRGPKKAIVAVAASILTAASYVLRAGVEYRDLGADYFDRRDKAKLATRLIARLHDLGLNVEVRAA